MAINWAMLQGVLKIIKEAGPLINDIKNRYKQSGVEEEDAQTAAEMTVVLDQIMEARLRDVARQTDIERLRADLMRELISLRQQEDSKRRNMGWVLLGAQLVIIILLTVVLIRI